MDRAARSIGVTRCSRLDDYVASVEQSGARRARARSQREPACARRRARRRAAHRRRRRRSGALRRGAAPDGRGRRARPRRVRDRPRAARDGRRPAAPGDLPRRAGAQRRRRRHARAGHPVSRHDGAAAQPRRSPGTASRTTVRITRGSRLHERSRRGASTRACTCRVNSRHHQSVGRLGKESRRVRDRPRRRGRSHRGIRAPRSASASSGTRRISGGPASSGRCSTRSSKPRGFDRSKLIGFARSTSCRLLAVPGIPSKRRECFVGELSRSLPVRIIPERGFGPDVRV